MVWQIAVAQAGMSALQSIKQSKQRNEQIEYEIFNTKVQDLFQSYNTAQSMNQVRNSVDIINSGIKSQAKSSGLQVSGSVLTTLYESSLNAERDINKLKVQQAINSSINQANISNLQASKKSGLEILGEALLSAGSSYAGNGGFDSWLK